MIVINDLVIFFYFMLGLRNGFVQFYRSDSDLGFSVLMSEGLSF